MPKIKAILFDLGKVLLFFNFDPAFKRLAKHAGVTAKDIENYFIQSGIEVLYDGGKITSYRFYSKIKKALGLRLTFRQFERIWNDIFTPNRPMIRLLEKLSGRYRTVLISNTNAMHYTHVKKKYAFMKNFDRHILSYQERSRKPDDRIYNIASKACRAKPHEIFYIDDRHDLTDAARELGFNVFTYRNNHDQLLKMIQEMKIL